MFFGGFLWDFPLALPRQLGSFLHTLQNRWDTFAHERPAHELTVSLWKNAWFWNFEVTLQPRIWWREMKTCKWTLIVSLVDAITVTAFSRCRIPCFDHRTCVPAFAKIPPQSCKSWTEAKWNFILFDYLGYLFDCTIYLDMIKNWILNIMAMMMIHAPNEVTKILDIDIYIYIYNIYIYIYI